MCPSNWGISGLFFDAIATFPSVGNFPNFPYLGGAWGGICNLVQCSRGALSCEISIGGRPSSLASAGRSTLDANCPQFQPPPAAYLQAIIFGWPPLPSLICSAGDTGDTSGAAAARKFSFITAGFLKAGGDKYSRLQHLRPHFIYGAHQKLALKCARVIEEH
jgi:hypothetical protein